MLVKIKSIVSVVLFGGIAGSVMLAPPLAETESAAGRALASAFVDDHRAHDHSSGWCFPKNDLKIGPDDMRVMAGGIDEATFNRAIDRAEAVYGPIFQQKGKRLVARRLWNDGTVNAKAYQQGSNWYIEMYGGLARHSATSEEGFYTVLCHEIGHHLGGAPRYSGGPEMNWAATEGQADYFATLKCMRKLFSGMSNEVREEEPGVRAACEASFSDPAEVTLCVRVAMGGYSSARLSAALDGSRNVNHTTPDPRVVNTTYESHPLAQCRLDTYFNGAICTADVNVDTSMTDAEAGGVCSIKQGHATGRRPHCWYKPAGVAVPPPAPTPSPTPSPAPNPTPTPAPTPVPSPGIALEPQLNGRVELATNDPYQPVVITFNVAEFPGVAGVYIEVSRPNTPFINPNGDVQDPNALGGVGVRGGQGQFSFVPAQQLPSWGTYYFRVIPLDSSGRRAVGKFSNSAKLLLQQRANSRFPRPVGFPRFGFR